MKDLTPGCYCIHEWKRQKRAGASCGRSLYEAQKDWYQRGIVGSSGIRAAQTEYNGSMKAWLDVVRSTRINKRKPWWEFWR